LLDERGSSWQGRWCPEVDGRRAEQQDFLACRQIHDLEIYDADCREHIDLRERREGRGVLTEGRCAADETVVTTRVLTGGRLDSTPATNSIWCQGYENDSLMTVLLLEIVSLRLWFRRCCSKVHGRQRENTKAGIQDRIAV
jgi:hypothetical protein